MLNRQVISANVYGNNSYQAINRSADPAPKQQASSAPASTATTSSMLNAVLKNTSGCPCGGKGCPVCSGDKTIAPRDKTGSISQTLSVYSTGLAAAAKNAGQANSSPRLGESSGRAESPKTPDSIAKAPQPSGTNNAAPSSPAVKGETTSPAPARSPANQASPAQQNPAPVMAKSVNINNTLQQINAQNPALGAAVRNTGSVPGPAMQVVVSARGQVQELNPVVNARTNPANNIQSAAPQTSVVKATGSVQITAAAAAPQISTVQTTGSAQITAAITPPTQPGMANKIEQIQQVAVLNSTNKTSSAGNQAHASASKQSVSISTSAHKQASQIATGQNSSSTPEPTAAQRSSQPAVSQSTSQAANSNNTNNSVNQTQTAGSPAGGNSTAVSAVPQGSLTGNMSTQILQTIQSPVLSNINPAAVVSLPFNPVGGLTMQNPISLNLSGNLGLGKAVQSGKTAGNAGLSFGDKISGQEQGVKDAQAKSQPIISFSTLSRIAHERDVQKENMLKLLGLLFGRVNKQEENDEDLEGMYGVWSDYIKQQREKKDQQQKEEQRKKEQKKKEEAEPELALA